MEISSNLLAVKILDASDLSRFVSISRFTENNLTVDYGGDIEGTAISSGSVSLTINLMQWEQAKALGDVLLLYIEGYWGGKLALDETTIDYRNNLVSVTAYGWLSYAEDIRYLNEIFEQAKLYGENGELCGGASLFFPGFSTDYFLASHAERGRIVRFLKNDPYKSQRESVIEGEFTVKGVRKIGDRKALLLDGLPEPPAIIMHGVLTSIGITGTYYRPVIEIPIDTPFGVFTDADIGGIITVNGTENYDGDYVVNSVLVPGAYYQQLYTKEIISTSEKPDIGTISIGCHLSVKVWRQKRLRFTVSERWSKNIAVETVVSKALTQLGIDEDNQNISLSLPETGEATMSTLSRGYSIASTRPDRGLQAVVCDRASSPNRIYFGMRWLRCYEQDVGEYYPEKKNCLYDFNEDQSASGFEGTPDAWYSHSASTNDWHIRGIVSENANTLWVGLSSAIDGYYLVRLNTASLESVTVTDVITSGYGHPPYSHVFSTMALYEGLIVHMSYNNVLKIVAITYVDTSSRVVITKTVETLTGTGTMRNGGHSAVYEDTDRYLASVDDAALYDIDLTTLTGSVSFHKFNYSRVESIAVAQGEDRACFYNLGSVPSVYLYTFSAQNINMVTLASGEFAGAVGYSAQKPGKNTAYPRFWTFVDKGYTDYLQVVSIDLNGVVGSSSIETYIYESMGQWINAGLEMMTVVSMDADYTDDKDVSLVQLGRFALVLRSPNFTGQSLREILQNLAQMACCWLWIAWDRSSAYFYAKDTAKSSLVYTVKEEISSYTFSPCFAGKITDVIDMGQWQYPTPPPMAYTAQSSFSVYGDYIDNALIASSVGRLWLDWLNQWEQKLEIIIHTIPEITIGSVIYWREQRYMVMGISKELTRKVTQITAYSYRGQSWHKETS